MQKQSLALAATALLWLCAADRYSLHLLFTPLYLLIITHLSSLLLEINASDNWQILADKFLLNSQNNNRSKPLLLLGILLRCSTAIFALCALIDTAEQNAIGSLHTPKLCVLSALLSYALAAILLQEWTPSSALLLYTSSVSALSQLLFTWTLVCQGGVCYTLYVSTFTSVLGAFGVTVIDMAHILPPLQLIFLAILLYSLFRAGHKTFIYPPLCVATLGAICIIISMILDRISTTKSTTTISATVPSGLTPGPGQQDSNLQSAGSAWIVYLGNALVVGGAVWNAKVQGMMGL